MKLAREALAHFLDSSWKKDPTKAEWEIIGEDIEDMSVDLNPDVSSKKTILGKTKTSDKGYEPSISADPYYAEPSMKIYPHIRDTLNFSRKGEGHGTNYYTKQNEYNGYR